MLEIPEWARSLSDPRTIDVLVCVDLHEACLVRQWVEEQVPGMICCVVHIPLAQKYLVLGLAQVMKEGTANDSNDPKCN